MLELFDNICAAYKSAYTKRTVGLGKLVYVPTVAESVETSNEYERHILSRFADTLSWTDISVCEFEKICMDYLQKNAHEIDIFLDYAISDLYTLANNSMGTAWDNSVDFAVSLLFKGLPNISRVENTLMLHFTRDRDLSCLDIHTDFLGKKELLEALKRYLSIK
jgi:hypothetical protein